MGNTKPFINDLSKLMKGLVFSCDTGGWFSFRWYPWQSGGRSLPEEVVDSVGPVW